MPSLLQPSLFRGSGSGSEYAGLHILTLGLPIKCSKIVGGARFAPDLTGEADRRRMKGVLPPEITHFNHWPTVHIQILEMYTKAGCPTVFECIQNMCI